MKFEFYKKGQGYYTRLSTGLGAGLLLALGCGALYSTLGGMVTDESTIGPWLQMGIPSVILVVTGWLIFKAVNTPRFADFLISTEGEMKKVTWSTSKEVIGSTKVVIFTVFLVSIFLAAVDFLFNWFFMLIGVLDKI